MKKIIFLTTSLVLGFTLEAHAVLWEYDLGPALQKAKTTQKPVMVDFYTDWCGWCKKLDSDTYSSPKVDELAKKFICVKVDADKNEKATANYQVKGYPTIIFLNCEGGIDERVVGYRDANDFAGIMSSVLKKTKKPAEVKQEGQESRDKEQEKSKFLLTGIFYDAKAPTAIINGMPVKVGDKIDGAIVGKITRLDVELEYEGSAIILNMK